MQKKLLTICGCLLVAVSFAQEPTSTTRKWFLGRGQKSAQEISTKNSQPAYNPTAEVAAPAATIRSSSHNTTSQSPAEVAPIAEPAPKTPKIEGAHLHMPAPTYNFGDVPRKGGDLQHEFAFTNDGTSPLVVTRVITSCSCLKAAFPKRPVAPGGSGVIRITYEPHKSEPGVFNKVIQVYSNSVDGRDVITVQGNSFEGNMTIKVKSDGVKIKIK